MNRTTVLRAVRMRVSDTLNITFTTDDLDVAFDEAVRIYSRHKPLVRRGSLSITNGVGTYAAPAGIVAVTKYSRAGLGLYPYRDFINYEPPVYGFPRNRLEDGILSTMQSYNFDYAEPALTVEWNSDSQTYQLRVANPELFAGAALEYEYTVIHTSDTSGENYPTIPDGDTEILINFVLHVVYETLRTEWAKRAHVQEGDTNVDPADSLKTLQDQSEKALGRALAQLDGDVAVGRG